MKKKQESLERCINQIFRPEVDVGIINKDSGNCYKCTYDLRNNKKCKDYYPIKVMTYKVR